MRRVGKGLWAVACSMALLATALGLLPLMAGLLCDLVLVPFRSLQIPLTCTATMLHNSLLIWLAFLCMAAGEPSSCAELCRLPPPVRTLHTT